MILNVNKIDDVAQATILPVEASLSNADQFKEEMITLVVDGAKLIIVNFENR